MEGYTRNRSQSVPILSQIEKVLDHREDLRVLERRTSETYSRFPETRSLGDTVRPKVKLSSGGLIGNQKRRRSRTSMGNTQTSPPSNEQENRETIPEQARPRAFTTSRIENTVDSSGTAISHSLLHEDEYPDRHEINAEGELFNSPPLVTTGEDVSIKEASDIYYSKQTQDSCSVITQQQTATEAEFYGKEESFHHGSSLSGSLQNATADGKERQTTDSAKSPNLDSANLDTFGSLITNFDRLAMIQFNCSEQSTETECFSDFERRRKSLPSRLEQRTFSVEMENSRNFAQDFKTDLTLQKNKKVKTHRSQSLPLTSSCFVGEVRVPLKDEYFNYTEDGKYGFRQPLDHIAKKNEQSRQGEKSRKTRSKSLPANMSLNLSKRVEQKSLQIPDRLHRVKASTRRVKSLPFIYDGFTECELLCDSQDTDARSHCDVCSYSDEKSNKVSNERKQLHDSGSVRQKAQLERASSFPLCGTQGQQKQTADIQEQLNKALDLFFSQSDVDKCNGGSRRSKSLPNVLEGKSDAGNYATSVEKLLQRNVPDGSHVCDVVSSVGDESLQSSSGEEKMTNDGTKTDASSDELELQISNTVYRHDPPTSAPRPRGFSIPSSFKMEKIPEEPNETEICEGDSICDHDDTTSSTNYLFKDHLKKTVECTALVDNSGVSEQTKDLAEPYAVNEKSSSQSTAEEIQQPSILEHNLEVFDKLVTESFSRMTQFEFASSSSYLHRAAAKGDLKSIKLLVERGKDVNALDESGWPVLHAAVTTGHFDCCEWLIDAGADLVGYTNFVIEEYRMLCQQVYQNY